MLLFCQLFHSYTVSNDSIPQRKMHQQYRRRFSNEIERAAIGVYCISWVVNWPINQNGKQTLKLSQRIDREAAGTAKYPTCITAATTGTNNAITKWSWRIPQWHRGETEGSWGWIKQAR